MKYTVNTIEVMTTTTGKRVAKCELQDEQGKVFEKKVSIWSDFADFQNIQWGSVVEGEIKVNDKGYASLYSIKPNVAPRAFQPRTGAIKEAMEKKEHSIEKFQGNKEMGIKVSSTMRDAVLIATTFLPQDSSMEFVKDQIRHWRQWLWQEFDKENKDFPPFN